jgi:regulator of nucleoside diphosphate kinase
MKDPHDVFLSAHDAAELRPLLAHARIVAPEHLPADRAAIGSTVVYREEPAGVTRTVTLCRPDDADGALDRLSVLSPAGLALLGRRPGSVVMATLRNGWPFTIRILDATPATEQETA